MLTVKLVAFDELPEKEKELQPNNGAGKEYAGYMIVIKDGAIIAIHSDAMEPEDCTFYRDLGWVAEQIKAAYLLGKTEK